MKRKIFACLLAGLMLSACSGEKPIENEIPKEPEVKKVSFLACGDNITYKGTVMSAKERANGERPYNFSPIFDNVREKIKSADISFINQETVMTESKEISFYPTFNSPKEVAYALSDTGFDVVNIATNHMLDKGADGLSDTIEFLKTMPYTVIGGYENDEDFMTPRIINKNGIDIAFISFTYDTNGIKKSASSPIKIPYIFDSDIKRSVEPLKDLADVIMVSMHWGQEGNFTPSNEQKRVAKLLADLGVDVIIGHHPHVIEPVEWIERQDGGRTLCVYSLGNFAAMQAYDYNMLGGIIEFEITQKGEEKPRIENVIFTPTVYHFGRNFKGDKVYYLKDYTEDLAAKHGVRTYYERHLSVDTFKSYVEKTIADEFLE